MARGKHPLTSAAIREMQPGSSSSRDEKSPPDLRTQLNRFERVLEEVVFRLRFKDLKNRNLPAPYKIRFRLAADADLILVKQLGRPGIIENLRSAGAPFDLIRGCKWDIRHKTLHLQVSRAQDEELVLKRVDEIGFILGLSRECGYIAESYCVHVFGLEWERKQHEKLSQKDLDNWGKENGNVTIRSASWTYNKLILEFGLRSDAQKMIWQDHIFLDGASGYAEAYDKRSTPMHCFNCGSPEHLRKGCNKRQRCLNCSAHGHYQWGCKADPLCPNCAGPHPAWAPQCVAEANIEMNAQCQQYRERELAWSIRPNHNVPQLPPPSPAAPQANTQTAASQPPKKRGRKPKASIVSRDAEDAPVKPKYNPVIQKFNEKMMANALAKENAGADLEALGLRPDPPKPSGEGATHMWGSFRSITGMKSAWNPEIDATPVSTRIRKLALPKVNDDESQPFFPGQDQRMKDGDESQTLSPGQDHRMKNGDDGYVYEDIDNDEEEEEEEDMGDCHSHRVPTESDSDFH